MINSLYLVATPIGNLNDITLRAINVLKKSDIIYCENTTHSKRLFVRHGIVWKKLSKYTDHDYERKKETILNDIRSGNIVSLISDAGSPLISDPGSRLVRHLLENDIKIETIPGPSSLISAIQLSGFSNSYPYIFLGFLPKKKMQKKQILEKYDSINLVFFSTRYQLFKDIELILEKQTNTDVIILNEITKKFEKRIIVNKKNIDDIRKIPLKGEFVICAEFGSNKNEPKKILDEKQLLKEVKKIGVKKTYEKYKSLYNIKRNVLYSKILEIKNNS